MGSSSSGSRSSTALDIHLELPSICLDPGPLIGSTTPNRAVRADLQIHLFEAGGRMEMGVEVERVRLRVQRGITLGR